MRLIPRNPHRDIFRAEHAISIHFISSCLSYPLYFKLSSRTFPMPSFQCTRLLLHILHVQAIGSFPTTGVPKLHITVSCHQLAAPNEYSSGTLKPEKRIARVGWGGHTGGASGRPRDCSFLEGQHKPGPLPLRGRQCHTCRLDSRVVSTMIC